MTLKIREKYNDLPESVGPVAHARSITADIRHTINEEHILPYLLFLNAFLTLPDTANGQGPSGLTLAMCSVLIAGISLPSVMGRNRRLSGGMDFVSQNQIQNDAEKAARNIQKRLIKERRAIKQDAFAIADARKILEAIEDKIIETGSISDGSSQAGEKYLMEVMQKLRDVLGKSYGHPQEAFLHGNDNDEAAVDLSEKWEVAKPKKIPKIKARLEDLETYLKESDYKDMDATELAKHVDEVVRRFDTMLVDFIDYHRNSLTYIAADIQNLDKYVEPSSLTQAHWKRAVRILDQLDPRAAKEVREGAALQGASPAALVA